MLPPVKLVCTLSPSLARAEPIVAMMIFVLCIVVDDINLISRVEELRAVRDGFNVRNDRLAAERPVRSTEVFKETTA